MRKHFGAVRGLATSCVAATALLGLVFGFAAAAAAAAQPPPPSPRKPNIVWIPNEDMSPRLGASSRTPRSRTSFRDGRPRLPRGNRG